MASRNLPFEFAQRWPQLGAQLELSQDLVELFDRRDRDLEDYLAGAERPVQRFNLNGVLKVSTSDIYHVPYSPRSRIWAGGVTVYGSGSPVVDLKLLRGGVTSTVATLTITSTGLFIVPARFQWQPYDRMWASCAAAGTGCEGFVGEVI